MPSSRQSTQANAGSATSYGGDDLTARLQSRRQRTVRKRSGDIPCDHRHRRQCAGVVATRAAVSARSTATRLRISSPMSAARRNSSAAARKLIGFPAADGKIRPQQLSQAVAFAEDIGRTPRQARRTQPDPGHRVGNGVRLEELAAISGGGKKTSAPRAYGRRALRQCAGAFELHARRSHLETRCRCAVARRHQERRAGRRSGRVLRSGHGARFRAAPQARGTSVVEDCGS